jgi:hypothetical protein
VPRRPRDHTTPARPVANAATVTQTVNSWTPAPRSTEAPHRGARRGAAAPAHPAPPPPFAPDPTAPLLAGSGSGSPTVFVLILMLATLAAVSLLDPAGLGTRVAAAGRAGRRRIARRLERPG